MSTRWIRQPTATILRHRGAVTLLGRDGVARRFEDASADVVLAALDFWWAPHTEEELTAHLHGLAGESDPALVAEITACLRDAGAIAPMRAAAASEPSPRARARVVVGVSGAIAATDAPGLVRALLARHCDVAVAMTRAAQRFVSADTLEALTHRPVYRGFWRRGEGQPAPHIHLATWADLVVVYPATATTIARVAHGTCDDVVAATVTATTRPTLIVPSMNEGMYRSPAVQRNLELLIQDGRHVLSPGTGHEVATAPSLRTPMLGAAPPPAQVALAVDLLLRDEGAPAASRTPEDWNRHYAGRDVAELPWFTAELDADLAEELLELPPGRLVDIGTGPGTAAIFAADNGFTVVGTDVSASALDVARRRGEGFPIAWVLDDIVDTHLSGRFDVALDRGCLHVLPRSAWPAYVAAVASLLRRGGTLLLKVHAPEEAGRYGTTPLGAAEIEQLFGAHFTVAKVRPSTFEGTIRPPPKALTAVLVRR